MTESTYKQAKMIECEISSIDSILNLLVNVDDFKLDPPTRDSGIELRIAYGENRPYRILSEIEAICIKNALKARKIGLQKEFERL